MGSGGGRSSGSFWGVCSGRRRTSERHARRTMASRRIRRWVRIVPFEGGMRTEWRGSKAKMRRGEEGGVDKEKKGLGRVLHREGGLEFGLLLLTWPGPFALGGRRHLNRQADSCGKRTLQVHWQLSTSSNQLQCSFQQLFHSPFQSLLVCLNSSCVSIFDIFLSHLPMTYAASRRCP